MSEMNHKTSQHPSHPSPMTNRTDLENTRKPAELLLQTLPEALT